MLSGSRQYDLLIPFGYFAVAEWTAAIGHTLEDVDASGKPPNLMVPPALDSETSNSTEVGSQDSENHDNDREPSKSMEVDGPEEELTDTDMQQPHRTQTSRLSRHT